MARRLTRDELEKDLVQLRSSLSWAPSRSMESGFDALLRIRAHIEALDALLRQAGQAMPEPWNLDTLAAQLEERNLGAWAKDLRGTAGEIRDWQEAIHEHQKER